MAEHALIVAHQVTSDANDQRSLLPMPSGEEAVGSPASLNVVADGGYSNARREACEAQGIVPFVPPKRNAIIMVMGRCSTAPNSSTTEKDGLFCCPGGPDADPQAVSVGKIAP